MSCLKARKMISTGCIYCLVWVRDVDSKTPTLELVLIINEFLEVFLDIPLEREITSVFTFFHIHYLSLFLLII